MAEQMLVNKTEYLTAGVHIGMKSCTPFMKQFVYRIRDDGLAVFNLQKVDERIRIAADFLSRFEKALIVSRKDSASKAIRAFAEATGSKAISGRFSPGTLTNPSYREFYEPDVVVVIDPLVDEQVIKEARKRRIPIVALCDTFNISKDIDLCVPGNNNGRKSVALILWILAREILKKKGELKKDSDFKPNIKDFGSD
jgi:small subunit ribosomal protein S2